MHSFNHLEYYHEINKLMSQGMMPLLQAAARKNPESVVDVLQRAPGRKANPGVVLQDRRSTTVAQGKLLDAISTSRRIIQQKAQMKAIRLGPPAPPLPVSYAQTNGPVQLSKTGKAATLLGVGTAGAIGAGVGALFGASVLPAALLGGAAYLAYKKIYGGPFIGGHNNIDTLQQGKGSGRKSKLGVGLINKGHMFSHSVAVVDRTGYDQSLNGTMGTKDLLKSIVRTPTENRAQASFDKYPGFDQVRGRVVTINTRKPNVDASRAEVARKKGEGDLPYGLLSNSCTTNVGDVLREGGLAPPPWAMTPVLLHQWAKSMNVLQSVVPE